MADIQKMLELNARLDTGASKQQIRENRPTVQQDFDKIIDDFDKQVYGPVMMQPESKNKRIYSAEAEMKMLQEHEGKELRPVQLEQKHIPKEIVESILANPLQVKAIDPRMDKLEKKLGENIDGIKKAANLFNQIQEKEVKAKAKINENLLPKSNTESGSVGIDYETIKNIINEAIDAKLNAINESITASRNNIPNIKCLNFKDNFYFVDNDDNVFECEMKYRGKRKKK